MTSIVHNVTAPQGLTFNDDTMNEAGLAALVVCGNGQLQWSFEPLDTSNNLAIFGVICVGFSDADHAVASELFPAQASEKRQGRTSRG